MNSGYFDIKENLSYDIFNGNIGFILINNYWNETFEEKIERMKLDFFIKEHPMFSEMKHILQILKSGIRIYNNSIMDIVRFKIN